MVHGALVSKTENMCIEGDFTTTWVLASEVGKISNRSDIIYTITRQNMFLPTGIDSMKFKSTKFLVNLIGETAYTILQKWPINNSADRLLIS